MKWLLSLVATADQIRTLNWGEEVIARVDCVRRRANIAAANALNVAHSKHGHLMRAHFGRQLWTVGDNERGVEILRTRLARPNRAHIDARSSNVCGIVALYGMANVACDRGDHLRAARLYGAAKQMLSTVRVPLDSVRKRIFDGALEVLRVSLGEQVFEAECANGASMTYQQAVDLALAEMPNSNSESGAKVHLLQSRPPIRGKSANEHIGVRVT